MDVSRCHLDDVRSFELIRGSSIQLLDLSSSERLLDKHLGEILRNCPAIHTLIINDCVNLSNDAMSFVNASRTILTLHVMRCPRISKLFLLHVECLQSDLTGVSYLEGERLKKIGEPVTHFRLVHYACPALQSITFKSLSLSGRELQMISDSSAQLEELEFFRCRLEGADLFFRQMRCLKQVTLHSCKGISDQEVLCFCSVLEWIDLTEAYSITDKGVRYVAERCKHLRHLTLKRCGNVTDAGILSFQKHASLEYLNLLGMRKVSTVALHRLLGTLPSINRVVHETIIVPELMIDRVDAEDLEVDKLKAEQASLLMKREASALTYVSASPIKSPRPPISGKEQPTPGRVYSTPTGPTKFPTPLPDQVAAPEGTAVENGSVALEEVQCEPQQHVDELEAENVGDHAGRTAIDVGDHAGRTAIDVGEHAGRTAIDVGAE
jgi:hypothetical protein